MPGGPAVMLGLAVGCKPWGLIARGTGADRAPRPARVRRGPRGSDRGRPRRRGATGRPGRVRPRAARRGEHEPRESAQRVVAVLLLLPPAHRPAGRRADAAAGSVTRSVLAARTDVGRAAGDRGLRPRRPARGVARSARAADSVRTAALCLRLDPPVLLLLRAARPPRHLGGGEPGAAAVDGCDRDRGRVSDPGRGSGPGTRPRCGSRRPLGRWR